MSLINRALQRAEEGIRRIGIAPGRIETPNSRWAGFTLRWKTDPAEITRGAVVDTVIEDRPVRFFVNDDSDLIQGFHLRGTFFEADELELIAPYVPAGCIFVDIGTNVGNHTLYALLYMGAARVIAFEPNPVALRVLELNVILNGLADRVKIHTVGLSDKSGKVVLKLPYANIGGAWLEESDKGTLQIEVGDELLAGEPVGFIKIDTEGMEMSVLAGLGETVRRTRPVLFVEVANENIDAFNAWCEAAGYRVENSYRRYPTNVNFLVLPNDAAPKKPRTRKKQEVKNGE